MDERKIKLLAAITVIALALVPPIAWARNEPFYLDLFARMMIFAIAALSLDLILGFGGMVSFGHAVFLGIGAYTVGILSFHGVADGFVHFSAAVIISSLVALFIGAVSLRTSGVFFIMITLAFGQMLYFLAISINAYGGDDGLTINYHSHFYGLIDLGNPTVLYYFVLLFLALFLWVGRRVVNSRFGMLIRGVNSNERRMVAIGFPTFRYKLAAFVMAGAVCGFAGALLANQTLFASPSIMHWFRSGELIVMVIIGGMATLLGPLLGAIVYLMLEHALSGVTAYWPAILGAVLVAIVLLGKQGLLGVVAKSLKAAGEA
jgi:branched-chain amino acid transport system permease protein